MKKRSGKEAAEQRPQQFEAIQGQRRFAARTFEPAALPLLLTAEDIAGLLCTTRAAVYAMVAREQLPGTTRIGRRVLFRSEDLLRWLDQKRAPSPKE